MQIPPSDIWRAVYKIDKSVMLPQLLGSGFGLCMPSLFCYNSCAGSEVQGQGLTKSSCTSHYTDSGGACYFFNVGITPTVPQEEMSRDAGVAPTVPQEEISREPFDKERRTPKSNRRK